MSQRGTWGYFRNMLRISSVRSTRTSIGANLLRSRSRYLVFGLVFKFISVKYFLKTDILGSKKFLKIEDSTECAKIQIILWVLLGVLLYALLCGFLPFEDNNVSKLYRKIQAGVFETPTWLSEQAVKVIKRCLTVDPRQRVRVDELMHDPWVEEGYSSPIIYWSTYSKYEFDEAVIGHMAEFFNVSRRDIKIKLSHWNYDSFVAIYQVGSNVCSNFFQLCFGFFAPNCIYGRQIDFFIGYTRFLLVSIYLYTAFVNKKLGCPFIMQGNILYFSNHWTFI